jgi:hypothetical protein
VHHALPATHALSYPVQVLAGAKSEFKLDVTQEVKALPLKTSRPSLIAAMRHSDVSYELSVSFLAFDVSLGAQPILPNALFSGLKEHPEAIVQ